MNNPKGERQLTARGLIIGCVGSAVISAASLYTALKMGSLPWPIVFAALLSLFLLKLFRKNKASLNEANVTHTAMSAGAMIAGGLAFTIPGIWILDKGADVAVWQIIVIALCGTALGLIYTALLRKRFINDDALDYPIGQAAAHSLQAADQGGKQAAKVFGSMGFAGLYAIVRDWFGKLPAMFFGGVSIPGVTFGILNSPMLIGIGFLVGAPAIIAWFAGSVIGDFGIGFAGTGLGLWDAATAAGIKSSLGMGCMIGCGVAVIIKFIMKVVKDRKANAQNTQAQQKAGKRTLIPMGVVAAAVAVIICFALQLGPLASIVVVVLTWLTVTMSAQSVGETGINPMEVFGVMVLLVVAAFSSLPQVQLFFVAAVVSVACGLMGDVMNDFKAGAMLGTEPKAQWIAQAAGGIVGAIVSALVLFVLVKAYGTGAFGSGQMFVAAQAEVVSTMIVGIPNMPAFVIGIVATTVLYLLGVPVITVGLGIYLPFYYGLTVLAGLAIKLIVSKFTKPETTDCIAAGFLGGESIVGVLIALISIFMA